MLRDSGSISNVKSLVIFESFYIFLYTEKVYFILVILDLLSLNFLKEVDTLELLDQKGHLNESLNKYRKKIDVESTYASQVHLDLKRVVFMFFEN